MAALTVLGGAALTLGLSQGRSSQSVAAQCASIDRSAPHQYPVTGFWVFPREDRCDWRGTLQAIHRIGGDTLIQFGSTLEPVRVDIDGRVLNSAGTVDPTFKQCVQEGATCYQAALADLKASDPANTIVQTYVYSSPESFSQALLRCPEMERRIVDGSRVYYRLLLPAAKPSESSCDFTQGKPYRLILVAGSTTDSVGTLLSEADKFGMKVFLGMPTFPRHPVNLWTVDVTHKDAVAAFTDRVLRDYARRHGGHKSFVGLYQTFEAKLQRWAEPAEVAVLQGYSAQHAVARAVLPNKAILASPYWDARRHVPFSTPPAEVKFGVAAVARTGVDIIAPQDGRGTGKAALFWPHQGSQPVNPHLEPVSGVGKRTYRSAYYAPTTAYYRAAAKARNELAREGRDVELWANVEAYEPTADTQCASVETRGRTDKARLDRALTFVSAYVSKVISYKWDGLYRCRAGQANSLGEQIRTDWDRPILADAFQMTNRGNDGLAVRGYRLDGSTITLTWRDTARQRITRRIVVAENGTYRPDLGERDPQLPDQMQAVWVPFPWQQLPPNGHLRVDVTNHTGKKATNAYYLYY